MKNALLLTGAAARISQEIAIIDKLIEKKNLEIDPENTMLAGFSSGALNIAAINACFRKDSPMKWDDYYKNELIFNISTNKVFRKHKFFPFNTRPLRNKIDEFCHEAGIEKFSDLTFQTYILAFSIRRLRVIWAHNKIEKQGKINLSDLLMGTSAIPILFPEQTIDSIDNTKTSLPSGRYLDGGVGGSFKRFKPHLRNFINNNGQLDDLYIISPMREISPNEYSELNKLLPSNDIIKLKFRDFKLLKIFLSMISMNGFDTFVKQFHRWNSRRSNPMAQNIYVCIPKLDKNYPILNFDKQHEQYLSVCEWADNHPNQLAIPISDYVFNLEKNPLFNMVEQRINKLLTRRERREIRKE